MTSMAPLAIVQRKGFRAFCDKVVPENVLPSRRTLGSKYLRIIHSMSNTRNFEIPDEFKDVDDGENFLLFKSGSDDVNRILVFGTEHTVRLLGDLDHWVMDDTFKIVPELFFNFTPYKSLPLLLLFLVYSFCFPTRHRKLIIGYLTR